MCSTAQVYEDLTSHVDPIQPIEGMLVGREPCQPWFRHWLPLL